MYLLTSMTLAVVRNMMSDSDPCYVMSLETIMELDHLITHEERSHCFGELTASDFSTSVRVRVGFDRS